MIRCHPRSFQRKPTGTRVPGAQILGEYEVLLVPVTGISKPGNTHEYPGNWQKGNTSSIQAASFRGRESGFSSTWYFRVISS